MLAGGGEDISLSCGVIVRFVIDRVAAISRLAVVRESRGKLCGLALGSGSA